VPTNHFSHLSAYILENANWLKPKQPKKMALMSSDEEGDDDDDDDEFEAKIGSDDDEDDDDDMLEVERQSRLIDSEMKIEREEAEEELRRTIAQETSVFHLPTPEELMDDENRVVPPSELRSRIEDILEVLADFKTRREVGRSRSEYIERLGKDMAELFGYLQELVDYFLSMFGPNECLEFLEASDKSRPLVVRVNTLKARRKDLAAALMKRGVRLDPLAPWSKVGLKIYESTVPIGATPEYLAGHYMLQSAASMCPVMALGPQPGDRVLDMSSAPGGKTSYISQLMRNKGVVIANDLKPERQKATVANLHRLGVRNVVTCCYDGRKIGVQMRNSFDRILLDAPCSGLGVISRDPSVKVQRTMPEVLRCAHLQKELLVAAIDALNHKSKKGGGFMVYSTCSVAVAENEEVVNYLLSKRDVRLVDPGLDFGKFTIHSCMYSVSYIIGTALRTTLFAHFITVGKPGFTRYEHKRFHPSVALTRRFYPHVHNMDGFYVAKIQKLSDKRKGEEEKKEQLDEIVMDEAVKDDKLKVGEVGKQHQQVGKMKEKKNNKRGKSSKVNDEDGGNEMTAQRKKSKISNAPSNVQLQKSQNKVKKNAKMSKPRRMKITGM
jgi:ribosomal RNA methyltransferase Nop2